MSVCARNLCNAKLTSENRFQLPKCCLPVKSLYDTEVSSCLCSDHIAECQRIMPEECHIDFPRQMMSLPQSSSLFKWEYDTQSGSIDYFSTRKSSRKSSERVMCLKPVENENVFKLVNVLYNEETVSDAWIVDLVAKMSQCANGKFNVMTTPAPKLVLTSSQSSESPDNVTAIDDLLEVKVVLTDKPAMSMSTPTKAGTAEQQAQLSGLNTTNMFEAKASISSGGGRGTGVREKQAFTFDDSNFIQNFRTAFFASQDLYAMAETKGPFSITKPSPLVRTNSLSSSNGSLSPVSSPSKMILKSMIKPSASCETLADFNDVCEFIPILVSIEGNIGAGKSTLLKALKKSQLDWCFIDEPLDTWTSLINDNNVNLLQLFYGDQHRWAYTFQNCAVLSRYQNIEKTIAKVRSSTEDEIRLKVANGSSSAPEGQLERVYKVFITERCLDTDYQVFAKMMKADGQMDSLEFNLYYRWYQLLSSSSTSLSAIVYVDTEPDTCKDRIKCRDREGEDGIPVEYLRSLHQFQTNWIQNSNIPCTRVTSTEMDSAVDFVNHIVADISSKFL